MRRTTGHVEPGQVPAHPRTGSAPHRTRPSPPSAGRRPTAPEHRERPSPAIVGWRPRSARDPAVGRTPVRYRCRPCAPRGRPASTISAPRSRRSRSSCSTSRPRAGRRTPTRDHRDRRGEAARRRAARPVRDAREPGRADPADHHRAHRHHRGDGAARAAHRRGAAPLLEFIGDAVIVGHNIRFDISFLDAALAAHGYPQLEQPPRRHASASRAGSCATRCRTSSSARWRATSATSVSPVHRAYADAAATAEVLPRAARTGRHVRRARARRPARAADDPRAPVGEQARGSPPGCPRRPGVYLFQDRGGRVLYVGQGDEPPRARVRSYFGGDDRPEGPAAPARDRGDRLDRVPARARGRGPRAAPDPASSSRASTGRAKRVAVDRVREAHARRALPAPHRGPLIAIIDRVCDVRVSHLADFSISARTFCA